jgi:hypothetical protein
LSSSVEDLRSIYPDQDKLCDQIIQTWIKVFKFFGTPRVWRTADAFARRLITEGTIKGFPEDCVSDDNSPIPGLEEALASALGHPGSQDHFDWLVLYAADPLWSPEWMKEGLSSHHNTKEWDESNGHDKSHPLHNWTSHGSDALQTGACGFVPDCVPPSIDRYYRKPKQQSAWAA